MTASNASLDLVGRIGLVTGAGRNIGREVALRLAKRGARVALTTRRNAPGLESTKEMIEGAGGTCSLHYADLAIDADRRRLVDEVLERWSHVDILVNNAVHRCETAFNLVTHEQWTLNLEVNVTAPAFLCQMLLPGMRDRRWGRIVNFSGIAPFLGIGIPKAAAKMAIVGLTRALAQECGQYGITCNCIAPGLIEVERDAWQEPKRLPREQQPLQRLGTIQEVGAAVDYLASESAAYVTGQTIAVNGGAVYL